MSLSKALLGLTLGLIGQAAVSQALAQSQPKTPTTAASSAANANCRNTGSFNVWLDGFRKEAIAQGISRATVSAALDGITLDPGVIAKDRKQSFFSQSFLTFSDRMISRNRIKTGLAKLGQYRDLFARVEKDFGVPGPVIAGLWALESDYGSFMGKDRVLRALATLAYDCRRSEKFRGELMDTLRIVERGDLTPEEMIGAWAGELGQTQFLASHYLKHAVDYDGDGRRNMISSVPDVIASTANFLKHLGWRRGEPWLQEVRVPNVDHGKLPWDQADLAIKHPRSQWAGWGVTLPDGRPLPDDSMPASLLLPMGRHGPAFLAYQNFQIYLEWNHSLIYCITVSYLGTRLAGARPIYRGAEDIPVLSLEQVKELQRQLARRGYDVGEVDGRLGASSRASVKAVQMKLGLPADSYPTPELLERLRGG
ncbi:MAG: lytic murein transglycosylase [Hyphomicrobiaceae bacterium]